MNAHDLKDLVRAIVIEAVRLRDAKTTAKDALINYACVFSQNEQEYISLLAAAKEIGSVVQETVTGPVFRIDPLDTAAGKLGLLKIRKVDVKRLEKGDADFTISDYETFKKEYLAQPGFNLIKRPEMEMIELVDPDFEAVAYFSNPPLGKVLGLDL